MANVEDAGSVNEADGVISACVTVSGADLAREVIITVLTAPFSATSMLECWQ